MSERRLYCFSARLSKTARTFPECVPTEIVRMSPEMIYDDRSVNSARLTVHLVQKRYRAKHAAISFETQSIQVKTLHC